MVTPSPGRSTAPPRKSLAIVVTTDASSDERAGEAVRLAAGLAAWRELRLTLVLQGPAARLVQDPAPILREGEDASALLRQFLDDGGRLVAPTGTLFQPDLERAGGQTGTIPSAALAKLFSDCDTVFRF